MGKKFFLKFGDIIRTINPTARMVPDGFKNPCAVPITKGIAA
jgi:hypothetical protein